MPGYRASPVDALDEYGIAENWQIEGEDFGSVERFRRDNDKRISQAHRMISVPFHQLEGTYCRCLVKKS